MKAPPTNNQEQDRKDELLRAGLCAASEARRVLASLLRDLPAEHPDVADQISHIVAVLYAAEVGDAKNVRDALDRAMKALRSVRNHAPVDIVRTAAGRSMALLHAANAELKRAENPEREETAPFLLQRDRIKSIPPVGTDDRRVHPRHELDVEVGMHGANVFFTGRTGDLSVSGLFVATAKPLSVGTELTLSFLLPSGYRIQAEAMVAWVRAPRYRNDGPAAGMGIRFLRLSEEDLKVVEKFLEMRPAIQMGD